MYEYKLYDKKDNYPFFIVRMPGGNIPAYSFYDSTLSVFLRILKYTLSFSDFIPKAKLLFSRMMNQGGNQVTLLKQKKKAMKSHPFAFKLFYCVFQVKKL